MSLQNGTKYGKTCEGHLPSLQESHTGLETPSTPGCSSLILFLRREKRSFSFGHALSDFHLLHRFSGPGPHHYIRKSASRWRLKTYYSCSQSPAQRPNWCEDCTTKRNKKETFTGILVTESPYCLTIYVPEEGPEFLLRCRSTF